MNVSEPIRAWWFSGVSRELRYGDRRRAEIGVTHKVRVTPRVCECGLHGSRNILSALEYAGGPVAWRVELSGEISEGGDQLVAQTRKYIAGGIDASKALGAFARSCAWDVVDFWCVPSAVRDYLESSGDEPLHDAAVRAMQATEVPFHSSLETYAYWSAYGAVLGCTPYEISRLAGEARVARLYSGHPGPPIDDSRRKQDERLNVMLTRAIVEADS